MLHVLCAQLVGVFDPYYLEEGVKAPTRTRHRRRFQDRPGPWLGRPWVPLVWASSVWSAAKPSHRERVVRGARERLLAWRDAFGRMQCGLSAASSRAALIGSWVGGGEGVQEGKIHAHGAPPDNLTRDALPTLCATAARRGVRTGSVACAGGQWCYGAPRCCVYEH